jgi:hypothetical protein
VREKRHNLTHPGGVDRVVRTALYFPDFCARVSGF